MSSIWKSVEKGNRFGSIGDGLRSWSEIVCFSSACRSYVLALECVFTLTWLAVQWQGAAMFQPQRAPTKEGPR